MKKLCAGVVWMLMLFSASFAFALQSGLNEQALYEEAMVYMDLEMEYERALEIFEQLGAYSDSSHWKLYCMGKIAIQNANELEKSGFIREAKEEIQRAISYYEFLSPIDFNENSRKLYDYCNARLDEYGNKGISQSALDKYAALIGTEDSMERFLRLQQGIPLPTQVPYTVTLGAVPAYTESEIETLMGPGKRYAHQETVQVNQYTRISICGKESDYYLIEVQTGRERLRCWALARKIQTDYQSPIPRVGQNGWKSTLKKSVQASYGPGEQYTKTTYTIPKGTVVTAYEAEGLYTMIECFPEGKLVRIWVKTEALSR